MNKVGNNSQLLNKNHEEIKDFFDMIYAYQPKQLPNEKTNKEVEEQEENLEVQIQMEETEEFYLHKVKVWDTLEGLSLKYKVEMHDIKRINNIISDNRINGFISLKIPKQTKIMNTSNSYNEAIDNTKKRLMINRFCLTRGNDCHKSEATYYLECAKYDFKKALELAKQDDI